MGLSNAIGNNMKVLGLFYVSMYILYIFNLILDRSFRKGRELFRSTGSQCKNCDTVGSSSFEISEKTNNSVSKPTIEKKPTVIMKPKPIVEIMPKPTRNPNIKPKAMSNTKLVNIINMPSESDFGNHCNPETIADVFASGQVKMMKDGPPSSIYNYDGVMPNDQFISPMGCVFGKNNSE